MRETGEKQETGNLDGNILLNRKSTLFFSDVLLCFGIVYTLRLALTLKKVVRKMLKLAFTKNELEKIMNVIHFILRFYFY